MRWEQKVQFATLSDVGMRRQNNEDSFAVQVSQSEEEYNRRGHLFLVADGMGGHAVGELASKIAAETIPHTYFKSPVEDHRISLQAAIVAANSAIHEKGEQNKEFQRMGTTCSVLTLTPRGAMLGHVGDSRCYRVRRDRIDQLTFDHSLEWEMRRRDGKAAEKIDFSNHRNIILRSLGPEPTVQVDLEGPFAVLPNDIFILCSDGLSNQISDAEIGAIARELSPNQACRLLIQIANLRGGPDNSTVIVSRVGDLPANVPPPIPESIDVPRHTLSWVWLIAFWMVSIAFVSGITFWLLRYRRTGLTMTGLAATALVAMLLKVLSMNRKAKVIEAENEDLSRTNLSRPHRTAVSLTSTELFLLLSEIEQELRRSATEENWSIDQKTHQESISAAEQAQREKRYGRGCRDLARAIDTLVTQMPRRGAKPASA
jgi:serine/threonine protein phosphatase PrpC